MERFHVAQLVGLFLLIFFLKFFALISAQPIFTDMGARQTVQTVHYANTWAVEVRGGAEAADALALKHGLINRGKVQHSLRATKFSLLLSLLFLFKIGNLQHYYLFMHGEEARAVTKDLSDLMATKTAALKEEESV